MAADPYQVKVAGMTAALVRLVPGRLDLEVYAGDANVLELEVWSGDALLDLTGGTITAQARKSVISDGDVIAWVQAQWLEEVLV